jgi:hypothetical protein
LHVLFCEVLFFVFWRLGILCRKCIVNPCSLRCKQIEHFFSADLEVFHSCQRRRKKMVSSATTPVSAAIPKTDPSVRKIALRASGLRPTEIMLP